MKIFIDVGAHIGETLKAVTNSKYKFDQIFCFEPAPECITHLEKLADTTTTIINAGLSNQTKCTMLYGSGEIGASIYHDKDLIDPEEKTNIQLIRAGRWFKENTYPEDIIIVKLNCEGSECDILDSIIDEGIIDRFYNVMVDFDVRKIPSMRHREEQTKKKLRSLNVGNVCYCSDVMIGESHTLRIHNWLDTIGAFEVLSREELRKRYKTTLKRISYTDTKSKVRFLLAKTAIWKVTPEVVKDRVRKFVK